MSHEAQSSGSQSQRRYRGIATAGASALVAKLCALLAGAATVPITVRYLGAESYGIWMTIASTVTMFFVLDIGISSTLTNLISAAYAHDDRELARDYFATALWILVGVAAGLGLIAWLMWPHLDWSAILNIHSPKLVHETSAAVAAALAVFLLALPMNLVSRVLAGYQELHYANLFQATGSILSLGAVISVVYFHGSLPWLVVGYAGASLVANFACMVWMCLIRKPWMKPMPQYVRSGYIGKIFSSGTQFFAVQVAGLVVFSSDNLIIAHYLSPAQVTPYAVTWRLVGYIAALQTLIFPALWPAYSEAWERKDTVWIRKAYSHLRRSTIVMLVLGCGLILLAGRGIIRIWAGPSAVPPMRLVGLMCVWIVIYAFTTNQSCLMGATSRVGKQAISSSLAAVANLGLSIYWVRNLGSVGVLLATVTSYLVFVIIVQVYEVRNILHGV
ncbi:MAG: lipopolysaccharide biosynthesis protein [Phycisphaerae bacterium]